MTSSPSFRRELPASTVAGGISTGLNSPRPEGTLSSMLSHLTLRMQARMKQYAIRRFSLCLPADKNLSIPDTRMFAFIPLPSQGDFPLTKLITALSMCHSRVRPVGPVYLEVHAQQYQPALVYFWFALNYLG